ncbi:type II toxin-antitoxin system prevent-host-death family antitoxin [Bdellovibrionota bacterium FG-1]
MKIAAISELKAKLARYIRLVKSGEDVEIRERGVPVARLTSIRRESVLTITPPRKPPGSLAKYRFSIKPVSKFDVLDLLLEDRAKR